MLNSKRSILVYIPKILGKFNGKKLINHKKNKECENYDSNCNNILVAFT